MNGILRRMFALALLLGALSSAAWTPVHADDMTCPTPVAVDIDIKPGSYPNSINLSSKGLVPVAVLSSPTFDASLFAPEMAHLTDANSPMAGTCSGAPAVRWQLDDVNKDGTLDLVFFFQTTDLDLTVNSTAAIFMAHGVYGTSELHIQGTDSAKVTQ